jgi:RNA polymerase sigma-70 factor (ECF subfamily)
MHIIRVNINTMADTQELAIISEVRSGDHEQYRFIVERYHRGLIQHLYNLVGDGQTAEDVAQDAFIRAYDKLDQYNEAYAFSTWLYKIADNIAYRKLKQTRPTKDIDDLEELIPDDKPSLDEITDNVFTQAAVEKAISELPIEYRQVISLYYWEDFSYEEIAEIMERPVNTIRTWLRRAKDKLRKDLNGQV